MTPVSCHGLPSSLYERSGDGCACGGMPLRMHDVFMLTAFLVAAGRQAYSAGLAGAARCVLPHCMAVSACHAALATFLCSLSYSKCRDALSTLCAAASSPPYASLKHLSLAWQQARRRHYIACLPLYRGRRTGGRFRPRAKSSAWRFSRRLSGGRRQAGGAFFWRLLLAAFEEGRNSAAPYRHQLLFSPACGVFCASA